MKEGNDVKEWMLKFDICTKANGWNAELTFLKKQALMSYLWMPTDDKKYDRIVKVLKKKI